MVNHEKDSETDVQWMYEKKKMPASCCAIGDVSLTRLPECTWKALVRGMDVLWKGGDLCDLERWGRDEDGFAYVSVYLCAVMTAMTLFSHQKTKDFILSNDSRYVRVRLPDH